MNNKYPTYLTFNFISGGDTIVKLLILMTENFTFVQFINVVFVFLVRELYLQGYSLF
jgi:hypothetical protein